jgi:hypothetical protein
MGAKDSLNVTPAAPAGPGGRLVEVTDGELLRAGVSMAFSKQNATSLSPANYVTTRARRGDRFTFDRIAKPEALASGAPHQLNICKSPFRLADAGIARPRIQAGAWSVDHSRLLVDGWSIGPATIVRSSSLAAFVVQQL